jgi:hypothetical protein
MTNLNFFIIIIIIIILIIIIIIIIIVIIIIITIITITSLTNRTIYNSNIYILAFNRVVLYVTNTTDFTTRPPDPRPIRTPPLLFVEVSKHNRTPFQPNYSFFSTPHNVPPNDSNSKTANVLVTLRQVRATVVIVESSRFFVL